MKLETKQRVTEQTKKLIKLAKSIYSRKKMKPKTATWYVERDDGTVCGCLLGAACLAVINKTPELKKEFDELSQYDRSDYIIANYKKLLSKETGLTGDQLQHVYSEFDDSYNRPTFTPSDESVKVDVIRNIVGVETIKIREKYSH